MDRVAEREDLRARLGEAAQETRGGVRRAGAERLRVVVAPEVARDAVALHRLRERGGVGPVVRAVRDEPRDDEADGARLAGRETEPCGEEARVAIRAGAWVASVAEGAGRVEVVPVDLAPVAPRAAEEGRLAGDLDGRAARRVTRRRVEREGELAVVGGVGGSGVAVEEDGAAGAAQDARRGGGAGPGGGEAADGGEDERLAGAVAERYLEDGAREGGDVRTSGDERAPGGQGGVAGEARVAEGPLADGELAAERHRAEVGQAAERVAVGAEAEAGEERLARAGELAREVAVEDAGVEHFAALALRADGEVRHPVARALGRAVEDLPFGEVAVAGHPDAAGADSADGERYGAQALSGERLGRGGAAARPGRGIAGGTNGRSLHGGIAVVRGRGSRGPDSSTMPPVPPDRSDYIRFLISQN